MRKVLLRSHTQWQVFKVIDLNKVDNVSFLAETHPLSYPCIVFLSPMEDFLDSNGYDIAFCYPSDFGASDSIKEKAAPEIKEKDDADSISEDLTISIIEIIKSIPPMDADKAQLEFTKIVLDMFKQSIKTLLVKTAIDVLLDITEKPSAAFVPTTPASSVSPDKENGKNDSAKKEKSDVLEKSIKRLSEIYEKNKQFKRPPTSPIGTDKFPKKEKFADSVFNYSRQSMDITPLGEWVDE